jgi:hypothetical protein
MTETTKGMIKLKPTRRSMLEIVYRIVSQSSQSSSPNKKITCLWFNKVKGIKKPA